MVDNYFTSLFTRLVLVTKGLRFLEAWFVVWTCHWRGLVFLSFLRFYLC